MERRYAWLADHGLKKVTVDLLSDDMPLLIVVIDELADLVSVGVTEEKAADQQRSTLIRRLIAKGRAAGVVVVAATQKPQADVVPTALHDLIQLHVGVRHHERCHDGHDPGCRRRRARWRSSHDPAVAARRLLRRR